MKCLCNPTYTHAQSEKLIDTGTLIYVNMVIVHRLISILCFFGHSHSSIDNSYELFICCTCYDNLSNKKRKIVRRDYTDLFYQHIMFRPSCHNCYFANIYRPGDLTLADFLGY